jgi:hypothetical protein
VPGMQPVRTVPRSTPLQKNPSSHDARDDKHFEPSAW